MLKTNYFCFIFQNKTGIIDVDGRRCFVMPLNRSQVLPPRDLIDLVRKMWDGLYFIVFLFFFFFFSFQAIFMPLIHSVCNEVKDKDLEGNDAVQ